MRSNLTKKPLFFILFIFIAYLSLSFSAYAIDKTGIQIARLTGEQWQAKKIHLTLNPHNNYFSATIQSFKFNNVIFKNLKIQCKKGTYSRLLIHCEQGTLSLAGGLIKGKNRFSLHYDAVKNSLSLTFPKLSILGGTAKISFKQDAKTWQASIKTKQLKHAVIQKTLQRLFKLTLPVELAGTHQLTLTAKNTQKQTSITLKSQLYNIALSNKESTIAAENLRATFVLNASQIHKKKTPTWVMQTELKIPQGEVYYQPFYIEIAQPIAIKIRSRYLKNRFIIDSLDYNHKNTLKFHLTGQFRQRKAWQLQALHIQLPTTPLTSIYQNYLQDILAESMLGELDLSGNIAANIQLKNKKQQVVINIDKLNIKDKKSRFYVEDLALGLHWKNTQHKHVSVMRWKKAKIGKKLSIGHSELRFHAVKNNIALNRAWHIPILDGALHINNFELKKWGDPKVNWQMQGYLQPISLTSLSKALDIPTLHGELSGMIPNITYKNNTVTLGGALLMQVFEGTIIMHTLSLKNPLGKIPILRADVDLNQINLGVLTKVYEEFGEVQGGLSGKIRDLHLIKWKPVGFDAYFATAEESRLPRKISQKAVSNLSSISGNSAADRVSRGVLQLFKQFSYAKLGLGCRLKNNICTMQGAMPAKQGYYIVKGGGLPRIDVMGYNTRVNWQTLLNRLKNIANAKNPVIKP